MNAMLIEERHDGRMRYPIKVAQWNLYVEKEDETNLYLNIETDLPTREPGETPPVDGWYNNHSAIWFVQLIEHGLRTASLVPGTVFSQPRGYDESRRDYMTNIYSNSSQTLRKKNRRLYRPGKAK